MSHWPELNSFLSLSLSLPKVVRLDFQPEPTSSHILWLWKFSIPANSQSWATKKHPSRSQGSLCWTTPPLGVKIDPNVHHGRIMGFQIHFDSAQVPAPGPAKSQPKGTGTQRTQLEGVGLGGPFGDPRVSGPCLWAHGQGSTQAPHRGWCPGTQLAGPFPFPRTRPRMGNDSWKPRR